MKRGTARSHNGGQTGLEPASAATAGSKCCPVSTNSPFSGLDES